MFLQKFEDRKKELEWARKILNLAVDRAEFEKEFVEIEKFDSLQTRLEIEAQINKELQEEVRALRAQNRYLVKKTNYLKSLLKEALGALKFLEKKLIRASLGTIISTQEIGEVVKTTSPIKTLVEVEVKDTIESSDEQRFDIQERKDEERVKYSINTRV